MGLAVSRILPGNIPASLKKGERTRPFALLIPFCGETSIFLINGEDTMAGARKAGLLCVKEDRLLVKNGPQAPLSI